MATKIDMAEQQLTGFFHRETGGRLRGLIISMGLTKKEWDTIKNKYKPGYLTDADIKEIDEILSSENPKKQNRS